MFSEFVRAHGLRCASWKGNSQGAGPMSGAQPMSVANALAAASAVGLPCKARLAMNADKLTEYDNITLKGHPDRCC